MGLAASAPTSTTPIRVSSMFAKPPIPRMPSPSSRTCAKMTSMTQIAQMDSTCPTDPATRTPWTSAFTTGAKLLSPPRTAARSAGASLMENVSLVTKSPSVTVMVKPQVPCDCHINAEDDCNCRELCEAEPNHLGYHYLDDVEGQNCCCFTKGPELPAI